MTNYNNYFNDLDNYFKKNLEEKIIKECCDDQEIVKDNTYLCCINCGELKIDNFDCIIPNNYLNQRFHNCTLIQKSVKYQYIRRLQHFQNYSYIEVTMLKSFKEIEDVCKIMKLTNNIFEGAKIKYKDIFMDLRISSRSNIKRAMYIYCVIYSCNYYKKVIDINVLFEIVKIKKKHYDKVLKKLEKNNIIFSYIKINKLVDICNKNDLNIDKELLIKKYKYMKKKKIKLNNNSILLGILYNMLEITELNFIKIFKTTKITLHKFNKIKDLESIKHQV